MKKKKKKETLKVKDGLLTENKYKGSQLIEV